MNADQLLAHYEQIADAPDAIIRLRRFILDLAVRGKLVEQDPMDEPASELLKRIAKEKARLVKAGEIKKSKPICLPDDTPIPVPAGWRVVPLGEVINSHLGGGTPSKNNHAYWGGDIRWASVKDVGKTKYLDETIDRITNNGLANSSSNLIPEGNLIVVTRMGLGQLSINRVPVAINQDLRALFLSPFLDIDFVYNFFLTYGMKGTGLTVKGIKIQELLAIPFPLPPLAEQHRIVAKVDELMALCDRLEAARAEREATRDRLAVASLARLQTPDPDPAAFQNHAAFALDNLSPLTTRPDQIKALRQTILNLAVRGKLVEQDPADEPASELLERIDVWRQESVRQKEIRLPRKQLKTVSDAEYPYPLPTGWSWVRIGQLIYIQSGDGLTSAKMKDGPVPVFGGNGVTGYHDTANTFEPTIVIGRVGYYCGSIHVTPSEAWITDNAFRTRYSKDDIHQEFLELMLNATDLKEQENATAQPVISGTKIYPIVVGLPPLAEQHRIVTKVDSLMTLCDRLEAALATTDTTRARLLEALLHEALTPGEGQEAAA